VYTFSQLFFISWHYWYSISHSIIYLIRMANNLIIWKEPCQWWICMPCIVMFAALEYVVYYEFVSHVSLCSLLFIHYVSVRVNHISVYFRSDNNKMEILLYDLSCAAGFLRGTLCFQNTNPGSRRSVTKTARFVQFHSYVFKIISLLVGWFKRNRIIRKMQYRAPCHQPWITLFDQQHLRLGLLVWQARDWACQYRMLVR